MTDFTEDMDASLGGGIERDVSPQFDHREMMSLVDMVKFSNRDDLGFCIRQLKKSLWRGVRRYVPARYRHMVRIIVREPYRDPMWAGVPWWNVVGKAVYLPDVQDRLVKVLR